MKTAIDSIVVEGRTYIPADSIREEHNGDWMICILQRGWVFVGKLERDGSDCKLHRAAVIGVWGTSKGLPELCGGPLSGTKLYPCSGVVQFDWLTVVAAIAVRGEKWENAL